ncbi:urease accessory protein UreF [Paenibacillus turpanensis]|uniref:urease accessory protein UreF n=1 Tax=Paenibacillus turpanensis TaxID=2689078 RepID=UPI00140E211D|nr:urease accessory protein UreF [Paenibacillus turpanensis]
MPGRTITAWLSFVQFLDSALPVGSFSHSFGLEAYVQHGRIQTSEDVRNYILSMLYQSWATSDALGVKAVYEYAPEQRWEQLWDLDQLLHVQRQAEETREGMRKIGRRLFQLGRTIYPQLEWTPLEEAMKSGSCVGTLPVVLGWIAWQLGIPRDQAVHGLLYTSCSAAVNCSLRLMAIGQTEGQAMLAELIPHIEAAWSRSSGLDPFDCSSNAFIAELEMMRHETLYSRLFMS